MQKLRENKKRAKLAEIFIWISAVGSFGTIVITIIALFLLKALDNNENISIGTLEKNVYLNLGIFIFNILIFIFSATTFIMWFRRAYYNQEVKFEYMNLTHGWASASWFVPILNLYRPYQMMKELFEEAENYIVKMNLGTRKKSRFRILSWWWFLWLFVKFAYILNLRIKLISLSFDRLLILNIIAIIIDLLCIVMAFLTIKLIRDYNKMEEIILSESPRSEIEFKKDSELLDSHI